MSVTGPKFCDNGDTAGAYLLGALSEFEAASFELHLADCAQCQRDIHELASAVDVLGVSVPAMSAPPELGHRIRAIVRSEAELLSAAGPEADRPARRKRVWGRGFSLPRVAVAGTLAFGIVFGLAIGGTVLSGSNAASRVVTADILQRGIAKDASATVRITGQSGTLSVSNFPAPPTGRVYEVWLVKSGNTPQPTDALFSVNTQGRGTATVPGSLHGVREILVTAEPLGGSPHPTQDPIISAST